MFKPENEMGVVVHFAQLAEAAGFQFISVQASFPDAILLKDGVHYRVEFEYASSNFEQHGHDPRGADLIICWEKDGESVLPILALSDPEWSETNLVLPTEIERESAYWKNRAVKAERELAKMRRDNDKGKNSTPFSCQYCGAEFSTPQGVSAHLRFCDAYKLQHAPVDAPQEEEG